MASCTSRICFQGLTSAGRSSRTRKPGDPSPSLLSRAAPFPKLRIRGPSSRLYSVGPVRAVSKEAAGTDLAGTTTALLTKSLMHCDAQQESEEQIARLAGDPQVVTALVHHLRTADNPDLRRRAAELLCSNITDHWADLPPHIKQLVKDSLVASIATERSPSVRREIADLVEAVARRAVPAGDWPELVPFLFRCGQSPEEDHREFAVILFTSLKDTTPPPRLWDLQALFLECLRDETSNRVSVREFILSTLSATRQFLAAGEEEEAAQAFTLLVELILETVADLPGDCVKSMVRLSLEVCSNENLNASTRREAVQVIKLLSRFEYDALKKYHLLKPILQAMWPLLGRFGDEEDDVGPREAAAVIEFLAWRLPKQLLLSVLEFALASSQHTNPTYREFSVQFLSVITKACPQLTKVELELVLHNIVLVALRDSVRGVRLAASNVLRVFAWHLRPEIRSQYRTVIPCILNALEDNESDREITESLYYALAEFSEDLEKEIILPFLDPVMDRLLSAIQLSCRDLQESCLGAISSIVWETDRAFKPYAERVLELMKPFMALTHEHDEDLLCRAEATKLVRDVAYSLREGDLELAPILAPYIEAAISGFSLDHSELRESTHSFFADLADFVYSADGFVKYLPDVVPLAFSSCNLGDSLAVAGDDSDEGNAGVDEKAAATRALGSYALCTKSSFAPYLEQSLKIMIKHSAYFHEDVRVEAITGLRNILTAAEAIFRNRDDGPTKTKEVLGTVMNTYIQVMKEDDNKEVVAQVFTDIAGIVEDHGYAALEHYAPQIAVSTWQLLQGKMASRQDDDPEHDRMLMDAVSALSKLIPADAGPDIMGS